MLYDTKGRFVLNKVTAEEAKYKILKIVGSGKQAKNVPYVVSHDGRTLRYPDPIIKKNDSVKLDLQSGKVRFTSRLAAASFPAAAPSSAIHVSYPPPSPPRPARPLFPRRLRRSSNSR